MLNRATGNQFSRVALLCGGVLVLASAAVLAQWAFGQPATLSLAPADGGAVQPTPTRPASTTSAQPAVQPTPAPAAAQYRAPAATAPTAPAPITATAPAAQPTIKSRESAYAAGQPAALLADRTEGAPAPLPPRSSPKAGGATGDQPQLEPYAITNASRGILAGWEQLSRERSDMRVVFDEMNGQALVYAAPAVHAQLRQQLSQVQPAANRTASGPDADTTATLTLKTLPAADLRVRAEKLLNKPLAGRSDATGEWQTFYVESAPNARVLIATNARTGEVRFSGPASQVANWRTIVETFDNGKPADGGATEIVATHADQEPLVRRAIAALQFSTLAARGTAAVASMLVQTQPPAAGQPTFPAPNRQPITDGQSQAIPGSPGLYGLPEAAAQGLLGPVQIQFLEGANIVIIRGREADVKQVIQIIERIEEITKISTPDVRVRELLHVNSVSMAAVLQRVYDNMFAPRMGNLLVIPLTKPNALLLVGPSANVDLALEKIVNQLDQAVPPQSRFEVFRLKYANATQAKTVVDNFLSQPATNLPQLEAAPNVANVTPGLLPRAIIVADTQTNSLIVSGGQQDIGEIAELIRRIDSPSGDAIDIVQVFPLRNATATALAEVLTAAFAPPTDAATNGNRNPALQIFAQGPDGKPIRSGALSNVKVTAEATSNALIVTAPEESMGLIKVLIERLDVAPGLSAQLKVFSLHNADALTLSDMLTQLFASNQTGGGAGAAAGAAGGLSQGGLVRLQFSYDTRTNSLVVAGAREDLAVVEAIIYQLDSTAIQTRETKVYRLANAFANNVALAAQTWLTQQRTLEGQATGIVTPYALYSQDVIIVAEPTTNNLIISASPAIYEALIKNVILPLDKRPPMVSMQVLIAEVRLSDTDEFGVELGLQDKVLFNRSQLSSFDTIDTTTTGLNGVTTTSQQIINAVGLPGLNFNNPVNGLGNSVGTGSPASLGTQGLSNFGVGRTNTDLGFSGFIFSAQSSGVNVLLRALQEKRRLEILSRPHLMALDAQQGIVQVGQSVPIITLTTANTTVGGQTNSYQYRDVGLILQVTPLISPDGRVVMQVYAEKSEVGPEAEGIPIDVSANGTVLRIPRIDQTRAQTVVSAMDGQTVVLGGLITSRKVDTHRRVPLVADVPLIGDLFRYDSISEERRELLIIITPRVVQPDSDAADRIKLVESSRMSWIMSDVIAVSGATGLRSRCDEWLEGETDSVYPNYVPREGELCPTCQPSGDGAGPSMQPQLMTPTPMLTPSPMTPPPTPPVPPQPTGGGFQYQSAGRGTTPAVEPARYQSDSTTPPAGTSAAARSTPPLRLPTVQ